MTNHAHAIHKPRLRIQGSTITATSIQIAEHFDKRHDVVLRAIQNLECSPEFTGRNFAVSEYTDSTGRKLPMYELTRDGFVFVAMGFTGAKAARWKEAYIEAFNSMETYIRQQDQPHQPKITDARNDDEFIRIDRRDLMTFCWRALAFVRKAEPVIGASCTVALTADLQRMEEISGVKLLKTAGAV